MALKVGLSKVNLTILFFARFIVIFLACLSQESPVLSPTRHQKHTTDSATHTEELGLDPHTGDHQTGRRPLLL